MNTSRPFRLPARLREALRRGLASRGPLRLALAVWCGLFGAPGAAAVSAQESLLRAPSFAETLTRAEAATAAKQWAEAAALWEKVVEANPVRGGFWDSLAWARYNAKDYPKAAAAFEKVYELGEGRPHNAAYNVACSLALAGKKEEAIGWLEKSFAEGWRDLAHAEADTDLKSLHDDPRFRKLLGAADTGKMTREEGLRHDLSFLARELKRKHYDPFRKVSRDEFEAAWKRLHEDVPRLSDTQFAVRLMQLMRLVGDGHTGLLPPTARPELVKAVPVQFFYFPEGLHVVAAAPAHADLVGAEVLRFNNHPVEKVTEALHTIVSRDNELWPKMIGTHFMRLPAILNGLGLGADTEKLTLTVRGRDGREHTATLAAGLEFARPIRSYAPEGWVTVPQRAGGQLPLYLKNTTTPYWFEYLPETKTVYFQYNSVRNAEGETLEKFAERLFKFVEEQDVEKLVLDMRWNNGGNTYLSMPLLHGLIRSRKLSRRGHLFVVIGRGTFSAAQNTATFIERHTPAIFVGEPTGSSPNFVGEDNLTLLPYSKLPVSISDLYWQTSWPTDRRPWIAPLLYAPPTFDLYRANRDPAMEAILAYR